MPLEAGTGAESLAKRAPEAQSQRRPDQPGKQTGSIGKAGAGGTPLGRTGGWAGVDGSAVAEEKLTRAEQPFNAPKNTSVSISPSGAIAEGSSVTLTCSSSANPPVKNYSWFKINGTGPLYKGPNYTIINISSADSGQYYCEAQTRLDVTVLSSAAGGPAGATLLTALAVRTKDAPRSSPETPGEQKLFPVAELLEGLRAAAAAQCCGWRSEEQGGTQERKPHPRPEQRGLSRAGCTCLGELPNPNCAKVTSDRTKGGGPSLLHRGLQALEQRRSGAELSVRAIWEKLPSASRLSTLESGSSLCLPLGRSPLSDLLIPVFRRAPPATSSRDSGASWNIAREWVSAGRRGHAGMFRQGASVRLLVRCSYQRCRTERAPASSGLWCLLGCEAERASVAVNRAG
nr:PREDICTED: uncharacterized protein LOC107080081 [Lepisosteus oculatus]